MIRKQKGPEEEQEMKAVHSFGFWGFINSLLTFLNYPPSVTSIPTPHLSLDSGRLKKNQKLFRAYLSPSRTMLVNVRL